MAKFFDTLFGLIRDANMTGRPPIDTPANRTQESLDHATDRIDIQFQDRSGNWKTTQRVVNYDINITAAAEQAKRQYPKFPVRGWDSRRKIVVYLLP